MKNYIGVPSEVANKILTMFGVDPTRSIECHVHFVIGEAVQIDVSQYAVLNGAILNELEPELKHYILTEIESIKKES